MVISLCGLIRSLMIEQKNLLIEDGSKGSFEYYSVEENDALTGYLIFNVPDFTYERRTVYRRFDTIHNIRRCLSLAKSLL